MSGGKSSHWGLRTSKFNGGLRTWRQVTHAIAFVLGISRNLMTAPSSPYFATSQKQLKDSPLSGPSGE